MNARTDLLLRARERFDRNPSLNYSSPAQRDEWLTEALRSISELCPILNKAARILTTPASDKVYLPDDFYTAADSELSKVYGGGTWGAAQPFFITDMLQSSPWSIGHYPQAVPRYVYPLAPPVEWEPSEDGLSLRPYIKLSSPETVVRTIDFRYDAYHQVVDDNDDPVVVGFTTLSPMMENRVLKYMEGCLNEGAAMMYAARDIRLAGFHSARAMALKTEALKGLGGAR